MWESALQPNGLWRTKSSQNRLLSAITCVWRSLFEYWFNPYFCPFQIMRLVMYSSFFSSVVAVLVNPKARNHSQTSNPGLRWANLCKYIRVRLSVQEKPSAQAWGFTAAKVEEYLNLYVNFKLKVTRNHEPQHGYHAHFQKVLTNIAKRSKNVCERRRWLRSIGERSLSANDRTSAASHILIMVKPMPPAGTLPPESDNSRFANAFERRRFRYTGEEFFEDPSAKTNSGDLGYFTAFDMVYPFESASL